MEVMVGGQDAGDPSGPSPSSISRIMPSTVGEPRVGERAVHRDGAPHDRATRLRLSAPAARSEVRPRRRGNGSTPERIEAT